MNHQLKAGDKALENRWKSVYSRILFCSTEEGKSLEKHFLQEPCRFDFVLENHEGEA